MLQATEAPVLRGAYLVLRAMRRIHQRRRGVLTNESAYRLSRATAHGGAGEQLPGPSGRSAPQPPPVMDGAAALGPVPAPRLAGSRDPRCSGKMLCSLSVSRGHTRSWFPLLPSRFPGARQSLSSFSAQAAPVGLLQNTPQNDL